MKRLFFVLLAATAIFFVSCTKTIVEEGYYENDSKKNKIERERTSEEIDKPKVRRPGDGY